MKLLIIVICLLSERYLIHTASQYRFIWFSRYVEGIKRMLPAHSFFNHPYVLLILFILPILLLAWLVIFLFSPIMFGFFYFLISLVIFYYCLGPENPFYPLSIANDDLEKEIIASNYFADINNQLFAVIFWFIALGPLGVLFYRLLSLCTKEAMVEDIALQLLNLMDWITTRVLLLFYLLVGNFQQAIHYYGRMFFAPPQQNRTILSTGGLLAARANEIEPVSLPVAQNLIEQALILYLVFIAFFSLVAWL